MPVDMPALASLPAPADGLLALAAVGMDSQPAPRTHVRWGMACIRVHYGTPLAAWMHEAEDGWY